MRYVVAKKEHGIEAFWCYYTDCDTCPERFKCYTSSAVIVADVLNMTRDTLIKKLKSRGIVVDRLAEF